MNLQVSPELIHKVEAVLDSLKHTEQARVKHGKLIITAYRVSLPNGDWLARIDIKKEADCVCTKKEESS